MNMDWYELPYNRPDEGVNVRIKRSNDVKNHLYAEGVNGDGDAVCGTQHLRLVEEEELATFDGDLKNLCRRCAEWWQHHRPINHR